MGLDPYPTNGELSHRQSDVLCLIADGKTTREIAGALVLSERTVERHIADIYAKIGARNRAEATAFYLRTLNLRAPALAESTQSNR
jgi:DNA-binding NarL/FixJ family response regulator